MTQETLFWFWKNLQFKQLLKDELGIHWLYSIRVESVHSIKFLLDIGVGQIKTTSEPEN